MLNLKEKLVGMRGFEHTPSLSASNENKHLQEYDLRKITSNSLESPLNDSKVIPSDSKSFKESPAHFDAAPGIRTPFCYPQAHANNRKSITCNILSAQKREFTPPKRHQFDTAGTLLQNGSALIHDKIHDAKVTIRRFGLATYLLETAGILTESLLLSDLNNTAISLSKGDVS